MKAFVKDLLGDGSQPFRCADMSYGLLGKVTGLIPEQTACS